MSRVEEGDLQIRVSLDLAGEAVVDLEGGAEPGDRRGREEGRDRHRVKLFLEHDEGVGRPSGFGLVDQLGERKRDRAQLGPAGIKEEALFQRGDVNEVGLNPAAQTLQGRQGRGAVLPGAGEGFQKSVITRKDGGRARDLLVALIDQPFENLRADPETGIDLGEGVLAVRLPDDEISGALQQGQERDEREKKPAPETAKLKTQG